MTGKVYGVEVDKVEDISHVYILEPYLYLVFRVGGVLAVDGYLLAVVLHRKTVYREPVLVKLYLRRTHRPHSVVNENLRLLYVDMGGSLTVGVLVESRVSIQFSVDDVAPVDVECGLRHEMIVHSVGIQEIMRCVAAFAYGCDVYLRLQSVVGRSHDEIAVTISLSVIGEVRYVDVHVRLVRIVVDVGYDVSLFPELQRHSEQFLRPVSPVYRAIEIDPVARLLHFRQTRHGGEPVAYGGYQTVV